MATPVNAVASFPGRATRASAALCAEVMLAALPHGGQRGARRNAWAAMVADHAAGRQRREAARAAAEAVTRAESRGPGTLAR